MPCEIEVESNVLRQGAAPSRQGEPFVFHNPFLSQSVFLNQTIARTSGGPITHNTRYDQQEIQAESARKSIGMCRFDKGPPGVNTSENLPVSRVDPRRFPIVVVDEIQFPVKVPREIPSVGQGYLTVSSPWHISLIKSIQTNNEAHSRTSYTAMLNTSL